VVRATEFIGTTNFNPLTFKTNAGNVSFSEVERFSNFMGTSNNIPLPFSF
jgi:hypothetical protein